MRRTLAFLACSLVLSGAAIASQEQWVPLSEIRLVSGGIRDSGEVSIAAKVADGKTWASVEVAAFGQTFTLDDAQRAKLAAYPPRAPQITYAPGYPELGGHAVHFRFTRFETSDGKTMRRDLILTIHKDKDGLNVTEGEPRPMAE